MLMSDSTATSPFSHSKTFIIKLATKASKGSQRPSILSLGSLLTSKKAWNGVPQRAAQPCDLDREDRFACVLSQIHHLARVHWSLLKHSS